MKRFAFRLESLRALREQTEEQAKATLGRELALEAERRAGVEVAAQRLSRAGADAHGSGTDLMARQAYVERCERDLVAARHALAQAEVLVAQRRSELVEAARDHETLARLKERRRSEHEAEARRAEDDALSEVGLTLHRRATA